MHNIPRDAHSLKAFNAKVPCRSTNSSGSSQQQTTYGCLLSIYSKDPQYTGDEIKGFNQKHLQ